MIFRGVVVRQSHEVVQLPDAATVETFVLVGVAELGSVVRARNIRHNNMNGLTSRVRCDQRLEQGPLPLSTVDVLDAGDCELWHATDTRGIPTSRQQEITRSFAKFSRAPSRRQVCRHYRVTPVQS